MKKITVFILAIMLVIGSVSFTLAAQESKLPSMSARQEALLKEAGFPEEEIAATKRIIELNNLTETQIENYITSKIKCYKDLIERGNAPKNYPKNINGESITPYGVVPTMNMENKFKSSAV